ncbi:MAG: hypothetical protein IT184_15930 [Acidobacteria bacterium]|nr:hypothetical protein [Acidobacteriota bacterium]
MATAVYVLCAATSGVCAALLLRMYRRTKARLLLWCTLSFLGWTISNVLVIVDLVILPADIDLSLLRVGSALSSMALLLVGLIWYGD